MSKKFKIILIISIALLASVVAVIINLPTNETSEDEGIFSTLEDENIESLEQAESWTENSNEVEEDDIEENADTDDNVTDKLDETSVPKSETESNDSNTDVNITYTETQQEPTTTAKPTSTPSSSTSSNTDKNTEPEPDYGEENGAGQIYDPAFGWITPSEAVGENVDNDGYVNTQVGSMS